MRKYHKWKVEDDVVAFYLHKFPDIPIGSSVDEIGEMLLMGGESMRMRIGNFVAVDAADGKVLPKSQRKGLPGLPNYAEQSAEVYCKYRDCPEAEIRKLVIEYLDAQPRRTRL